MAFLAKPDFSVEKLRLLTCGTTATQKQKARHGCAVGRRTGEGPDADAIWDCGGNR
jgi:hypothetical protein